jgi:hypothetical protein
VHFIARIVVFQPPAKISRLNGDRQRIGFIAGWCRSLKITGAICVGAVL